jgi:hypothetical protein
MELYSSVPTVVEVSNGVNKKWLVGDTRVTSYCSFEIWFPKLNPPHPEPKITTFGFYFDSRGGRGIPKLIEASLIFPSFSSIKLII